MKKIMTKVMFSVCFSLLTFGLFAQSVRVASKTFQDEMPTKEVLQLNKTFNPQIHRATNPEMKLVSVTPIDYSKLNIPRDAVLVSLEAHDVWGDGSGYQLLLDATATEFGVTIPATGALTADCNVPATLYDVFSHKIPENADPSCASTNIVYDGIESIMIPAGTYDYCITNPTPGSKIWIASDQCDPGRADDYVFEAGKAYHFAIAVSGTNDCTTITVENTTPVLPDAPTNLVATANEDDITITWDYAEPPSDAIIILEAHDVWGDGTGYQILLDADHNTSANITGNFICGQSYAEYEYMIPTNATAADDFVVVNGSETIQVPAGVYDYVVLNPGCNQFAEVYVASDQCDASVGTSVTFAAGQTYHFTATLQGQNDCITITNQAKNRADITFNVYRDATKIANVTEHSYVDEDVEEGTYCYTVTAVNDDEMESEPSNEDCETVVGINELDAAFQIFPNPADAKVTVKGENVESIAVYNVLGQMVDNINVTNISSKDINTAAYESGVYMLRITTNDGNIVSKRIIIAH